MRPHKLMMKAFGPFVNETVVDFDAMGNSIYLISGDTGAGKTTIFDGLIYALYGTASGGARSRLGTEAFHSDYAKEGGRREEMRVELSFSNGGRNFTVSRRMYWGRKGDSRAMSRESVLTEDGNAPVFGKGREDKDDVTRKVTEILGLDADQFRRIIMLAQGEFQKFLTAKSDERGVILGKLYDNRVHQDFQLRLKAAASLLRENDSAAVEEAKAQIRIFRIPEAASLEQREALSADHPKLLAAVSGMTALARGELKAKIEAITKKELELRKLRELKTRGETRNALLDDLEAKRSLRADLEKKKESMEALRTRVNAAEAAEKVLPYEMSVKQAEEALRAVREKIAVLKKTQGELYGQAETLKEKAAAAASENEPRIRKLKEQALQIRAMLHFYDDLERSLADQEARKRELENAEEKAQKVKSDLEEKKRRKEELAALLESLSDVSDLSKEKAALEVERLRKRQEELSELALGVNSARKLSVEEADLAVSLAGAREAELRAEEEHLRMNRALLKGQAGILAKEMREKLKTEDFVTCPVCGVVHTAGDAHQFAESPDEVPDREAVDKAYAVYEEARRAAGKAQEKYLGKANELSVLKNTLLLGARNLLFSSEGQEEGQEGRQEVLWETLLEGGALNTARSDYEEQIAKARLELDKAASRLKEKEKASKGILLTQEEITALEEQLAEALQKKSDAGNAKASADTSVANWRKQLKGSPKSKAEALDLISQYDKEAEELNLRIDCAREEHAKCMRELAANDGRLQGAVSEEESCTKALEGAASDFRRQIRCGAFADEEAYRAALSPEGELLDLEGIQAWTASGRREIEGFDKDLSGLDAAVKQLEESTKGMEREDLEALDAQIAEETQLLSVMKAEESDASGMTQADEAVYSELIRILERREKYRRLEEELGPLADAADGKYSFSRYVLGSFFHSVVEQANLHLETMTDGEYCLVPKEYGDGRSNLGLELKVLSTITGLERDTASLSGGQLFEASLSLALGLSDVVQMESSSTIRIDSMFIDEGFGSLDDGRLDKAISVLQHLSGGKRQIGIISHVARLDECLPNKIHVIAGKRGSSIRKETEV